MPEDFRELEIAFYSYINDSSSSPLSPIYGKNSIDLTPSSLVPHQEIQETFWRGKVINAVGQFVQFEMTQSEEQMESIDNSEVPFILHAIHLKVNRSGRIEP